MRICIVGGCGHVGLPLGLVLAGAECDVIALHPSSPTQFGLCAGAGADAVALSADQCRALFVHPLTDRGVDQFLGDVARLRRSWPLN